MPSHPCALHPCKPLLEGSILIITSPGIRITKWHTFGCICESFQKDLVWRREGWLWVWVVAPCITWVDSGAELKGKKKKYKRRDWDLACTSPTCPSVNAVCTAPHTPAVIDQIPPQTMSQNEPFFVLIAFFFFFGILSKQPEKSLKPLTSALPTKVPRYVNEPAMDIL